MAKRAICCLIYINYLNYCTRVSYSTFDTLIYKILLLFKRKCVIIIQGKMTRTRSTCMIKGTRGLGNYGYDFIGLDILCKLIGKGCLAVLLLEMKMEEDNWLGSWHVIYKIYSKTIIKDNSFITFQAINRKSLPYI